MLKRNYKHWLICLSMFCCLPALVMAGDNLYPAAAIPADLRKGADAVVRSEKTTFRIISAGKAIETTELAITILNERGDRYAQRAVGYDKLTKLKTFEGALYAADGKLLRKLKKGDIYDGSAYTGSFVDDARFKAAQLEHKQYPYTVVWTTELESSNTMFYPSWTSPVDEKVAVEHASLVIICPQGRTFKHRSFGLSEPQTSTDKDGNKVYLWAVTNQQAREEEPLAPYWHGKQMVITTPVDFEIDGHKGNMQSWQQYGMFLNQLNQGRDVLPQEAANKVKELSSKHTAPEDKVKAIYEYMQQNTRYISIQLGIGGWQPFEAAYVSEKGYGDCKALSNYTKALLKAAGFRAHYAIIRAGADEKGVVLEDFPMSYFNHAVLCVPLEKDTVWLECTSQTNPFGHLGSFTGNRKALLITEEGGKLVNTRTYKASENHRITKTIIDLHQEQPAYQLSRTYGGILFDRPYDVMRADQQNQKNWLYQQAGLPDISLRQYQLKKGAGATPSMLLEADGTLQEKQMRSGNRLFVPLSLGKFPLDVPKPAANRKTDFVQNWGLTYTDTLVYKVPASFKPEHLPEPQHFQSDFGSCDFRVVYQGGQIISVAKLRLQEGRFPAARYAEWVAFVQQVKSAYTAKAVLVQGP